MLGGTNQTNMIVLAGILLIIGAACVFAIKETYAEAQTNTDKTPVLEDILKRHLLDTIFKTGVTTKV